MGWRWCHTVFYLVVRQWGTFSPDRVALWETLWVSAKSHKIHLLSFVRLEEKLNPQLYIHRFGVHAEGCMRSVHLPLPHSLVFLLCHPRRWCIGAHR